ncbi:hypothetical protein CA606_18380 [Caulobacter vibrioides]|uniref:Uncharacterized protein n=1 Tax=Caulobacter vibrioides TaxID=155892 RepID=A0A290N0D3_CAUVI|nr:hypothetical protein CA606_18380 [Caulobacter vibrioides]
MIAAHLTEIGLLAAIYLRVRMIPRRNLPVIVNIDPVRAGEAAAKEHQILRLAREMKGPRRA